MAASTSTQQLAFRRNRILALCAFGILLSGLLLSTRARGRPPEIESVSPQVGVPGDVLVIAGRYLGAQRDRAQVRIAGISLPSANYLEWSDTRVSVVVPEEINSGLVTIRTQNGVSKAEVFANRNQIPIAVSGPLQPGYPYIDNAEPQSGAVGTLLRISGVNFGLERVDSQVRFTWISEDSGVIDYVAASERDMDYESWSDSEVWVRIPDGASSGNVYIVTDKGASNAVYVEVEFGGSKLFLAKRTYSLQYGVSIDDITARKDNGLYLWLPTTIETPGQRNIQTVYQDPAPIFEDVKGTMLFFLQDLEPGTAYTATRSVILDRYAIESSIHAARIPYYYEKSKLFDLYTADSDMVPSANRQIASTARVRIGRERSPYWKARSIYNYVRARLSPVAVGSVERDILKAFNTREGDSYVYAILFCAMCRAVGVPARPIAGLLIDDDRQSLPHFWAEFYLPQVGWLPVDPFLAEGKGPVTLPPQVSTGNYYFGSCDNRHIILSRGMVALSQMDPDGRSVRRDHNPDLQTIHEEAVGQLTSYRAVWHAVEVLGIY